MAQNVTHTVIYTYNGDGVRVAQSADGVETRWVQDTTSGLAQVLIENANSKSQVYVYGVGRLAQFQDDAFEWFLDDALGSVRQVVAEGGEVLLARDYDPYGQVLAESGAGESGYGFTGEQQNVNTGLVFLRARYYAPGQGRFLAQDPWSGNTQVPQPLNRFLYVLDRPVVWTDPAGLCPAGMEPYCRVRAQAIEAKYGVYVDMDYNPLSAGVIGGRWEPLMIGGRDATCE